MSEPIVSDVVTEPVFARPSSTVILLRDGTTGVEMFLVRRHELSGFANLAYVFPGGSVVAADTSESSTSLSTGFSAGDAAAVLRGRSDVAPDDDADCLSYWIAAARELLEEAGVLIHDGSRSPSQEEVLQSRIRSLENGDDFADSIRAMSVGLGLERLVYFSHWRTPKQSPKRYDTRFFVAAMPDDQIATHCNIETTDSLWISPTDALARNDEHTLRLVSATRSHIARLAPYKTVADVLEFAGAKQVRCVEATIRPDKSVYIDPELLACW